MNGKPPNISSKISGAFLEEFLGLVELQPIVSNGFVLVWPLATCPEDSEEIAQYSVFPRAALLSPDFGRHA